MLGGERGAVDACGHGGRRSGGRLPGTGAPSTAQRATNCLSSLAAMLMRAVRPWLEGAGRGGGEVGVAHRLRRGAGIQVVRHDPAHRGQRRLQHGNVDQAALAGLPGAQQGRRDGEGRGQAADGVGHGEADPQAARWRRRR